MNFTGYFEKLSEYIEQVNNYCPRLEQYKEIFNEFQRFRDAVDDFYAIVIVFCSEALKIVQGKGSIYLFSSIFKKIIPASLFRYGGAFVHKSNQPSSIGFRHYFKLFWFSVMDGFAPLQETLQGAKNEIDEEIKLASEQRQRGIQSLQIIEQSANQKYRQRQDIETQRNQRHRSKQSQALLNIQKNQIQRLIKDEGKSAISTTKLGLA